MDTVFSFNNIPSNWRVPGFYLELDPSQANTGTYIPKVLILGQMLSTGSASPEIMYRLTSASEAISLFGAKAMITQMLALVFYNNPEQEVWACAQADIAPGSGGSKATVPIIFSGSMAANGVFVADVSGIEVRIGVTSTDTNVTIVALLAQAITDNNDVPLNAAVGGSTDQLVLTANHAGENGNDAIVTMRFIDTAGAGAAGVTVNASDGKYQLAGGATNPDITNTLAAMGDEWYRWIANPYKDSANLTLLATELNDRFGPVRAIGARAFCAIRGTNGQAAAFGDTQNSEHLTCMGMSLSPQPSYLWAAVNAVVAGNSLAKHSSRPLRTLPLRGLIAPKIEDRFTKTQQNLMLFDGISTFAVASDGTVMIDKQITMRQETALGLPDNSLLSINAPEQYEDYRFDQKLLFAPHVRDILSENSPRLPEGVPIITPAMSDAMLEAWYEQDQVETIGRCELPENYKPKSIKNGGRIELIDNPNFTEGLEQVYIRSEMQP